MWADADTASKPFPEFPLTAKKVVANKCLESIVNKLLNLLALVLVPLWGMSNLATVDQGYICRLRRAAGHTTKISGPETG